MSRESFALKNTLIIITVLFVLGYAVFNSRFIIQGPELTLEQIDEHTNSVISPEKTFFLKGKIEHSSFISINGRPIFIDESGNFSEKLLLSNGISIIDIYAKDKFGKEIRKKIDVLYQGEPSLTDYTSVAMAATASSSPELPQPEFSIETEEEVATSSEEIDEGTPTLMMSTLSASTSTSPQDE